MIWKNADKCRLRNPRCIIVWYLHYFWTPTSPWSNWTGFIANLLTEFPPAWISITLFFRIYSVVWLKPFRRATNIYAWLVNLRSVWSSVGWGSFSSSFSIVSNLFSMLHKWNRSPLYLVPSSIISLSISDLQRGSCIGSVWAAGPVSVNLVTRPWSIRVSVKVITPPFTWPVTLNSMRTSPRFHHYWPLQFSSKTSLWQLLIQFKVCLKRRNNYQVRINFQYLYCNCLWIVTSEHFRGKYV